MRPVVEGLDIEDAIDIGASAGYFTIELARLGVHTIAIEPDPANHRTTLLAVRRSGLRNIGVLALELRPDNMRMLPPADCTLFLSLWHHLVRNYGFEASTGMFREIWARTGTLLVFDTGEREMPPEFQLPARGPEPREWLERYLRDTCDGSAVEHIGTHAAFDDSGRPCKRNLFAVIRQAP
jgi:hypothetical protein